MRHRDQPDLYSEFDRGDSRGRGESHEQTDLYSEFDRLQREILHAYWERIATQTGGEK